MHRAPGGRGARDGQPFLRRLPSIRQNRVSTPATDIGRADGRVLGPPAQDGVLQLGIARLGIGQHDGRDGSGNQCFHLNFDAP